MLEKFMQRTPYVVWDTKRKALVPPDEKQTVPELLDGVRSGSIGLVVAPNPQSVIQILHILDMVPENLDFVGCIHVHTAGEPDIHVFDDISDDVLLVAYNGIETRGSACDIFSFSLDPDTRAVTVKEVPDEIQHQLTILDNERCFASAMSPHLARAFGCSMLGVVSFEEKGKLAALFGCSEPLEFFPDDFPRWRHQGLNALALATEPMLADNINDLNAAKLSIYEMKSRVPEIVKYRPLWLGIVNEEAECRGKEVTLGKKLDMIGISEKLYELGEKYGIESMKEAVDAGVPAEDIVLSSMGTKPSLSSREQQKAYDRIVEHIS